MLLVFTNTGVAAGEEKVQHYKMISTVKYVGQGQFGSQVEELFTVRKMVEVGDPVLVILERMVLGCTITTVTNEKKVG